MFNYYVNIFLVTDELIYTDELEFQYCGDFLTYPLYLNYPYSSGLEMKEGFFSASTLSQSYFHEKEIHKLYN